MKFETEISFKIQECSWSVSNPSIKAKPRWHGRSEVEAIQFQGKTEDQEKEEAVFEIVFSVSGASVIFRRKGGFDCNPQSTICDLPIFFPLL